MSDPSHERKYELVVNANVSELTPEAIRELCFDRESSAWLLGLLDRGLRPPQIEPGAGWVCRRVSACPRFSACPRSRAGHVARAHTRGASLRNRDSISKA